MHETRIEKKKNHVQGWNSNENKYTICVPPAGLLLLVIAADRMRRVRIAFTQLEHEFVTQ